MFREIKSFVLHNTFKAFISAETAVKKMGGGKTANGLLPLPEQTEENWVVSVVTDQIADLCDTQMELLHRFRDQMFGGGRWRKWA